MHLKAVELVGFKSFADKTRLSFEKGITSVVGPNGCGKSNVVDAIRWCIGEMSWKSLRSGSMVDIIFNGTAKRNPTNFAEVTMVFDNFSKRLPVDFAEVEISRKIYRSGESEYFLNKTQCRLRDIRDLFLDTGIGGGGYAIIDQGEVNFILQAKPEERRELFEEAAGVSKYKAKREEAIKKLEKVDADLARVSDTRTLIDEQIKKLDSDAKKARLYKKYKEELRDSEIALALSETKTCENEISEKSKEIAPLAEKLGDEKTKLSQIEGEISALNLNLTYKQNELSQCGEKVSALKYQAGKLEGEIANCVNMSAELARQTALFDEEDALAEKRLEEIAPAFEKLRTEFDALELQITPIDEEKRLKGEETSALENALFELDKKQDRANLDFISHSQNEMDISRSCAFLESEIAHISEDIINLGKEKEKTTEQFDGAKRAVEELQGKIAEKSGTVGSVKTETETARDKRKNLEDEKASLQKEISSLTALSAELNATLSVARKQGENNPYYIGVKRALAEKTDGVMGTLRQNLTVPADKKSAVEDIAGKFLDAVICRDKTTAENALSLVKNTEGARCAFIILSEVPAAAPEGGGLAGELKYPDELGGLVNYLFNNCSAEGGDVKSGFWISGGNGKPSNDYWEKEEEITAHLSATQAQKKTSEEKLSLLEKDLAEIAEQISSLESKYSEEKIKLNSLENELASGRGKAENLQKSLELIEKEAESLSASKTRKTAELGGSKTKLSEIKTGKEEITASLAQLKEERVKTQETLSALKTGLDALHTKLYSLKDSRGHLETDRRNLELQRENINSGIKKRAAEKQNSARRIAEFNAKKQTSEQEIGAVRGELAELEKSETVLREALIEIKTEYETKSETVKAVRKSVSDMEISLRDLENALSSAREKREGIEKRLNEDWSITSAEANMKYADFEVDHDRVKMMRRRLENMGAVNMTAPEEYDALAARSGFLTQQTADLEQAKNDLRAAITKINSATRESFRYTFEQVKENFKKIYQTLFVGGEADIVFTNPENLLETGIEIIARPPGKKLQSISSLSGGEQALTALSLLFSFFVVNPSPFCIMDEADAPLDDANIERFINLLKEFAGKTQFIVITHNRRTMEAADVLYGVTMEERGVSKAMSVMLRKEGEKPAIPEGAVR